MHSTGWVCREEAQVGGDVAGSGRPRGSGWWAPPGKCCGVRAACKGAAPTPGTADSMCGGIPAKRPKRPPRPTGTRPGEQAASLSSVPACCSEAGVDGRARPEVLRAGRAGPSQEPET